MNDMLQLNPYIRQSARELLRNRYFDKVRSPANEHQNPQKVKLPVDSDQAFNYEKGESETFSKLHYMEMMREVIN